MSSKKKNRKSAHFQGVQHTELSKKNKQLSDDNKQLDSRNKALSAEVESLKSQLQGQSKEITKLKEQSQRVVIKEPEEDHVAVKVIDKLMELEMSSSMNKMELSSTALEYQRKHDEQRLATLQKEQEILSNSPDVLAAKEDRVHKIKQKEWLMRMGGLLVMAGVGLTFAAVFYKLSALIPASGSLLTGAMFIVMGYAPNVSAEDTEKVERLAKAFRLNFQQLEDKSNDVKERSGE